MSPMLANQLQASPCMVQTAAKGRVSVAVQAKQQSGALASSRCELCGARSRSLLSRKQRLARQCRAAGRGVWAAQQPVMAPR